MTEAQASSLFTQLHSRMFPHARTSWWQGLIVACISVAIAVIIRSALEGLGQFYYLPLVPAVMATALLANRWAVAVSILLAVACNIVLVDREHAVDAAANAALFVVVAWSVSEVCLRLVGALSRSRKLTHDLVAREALLDAILASTPVITLDRTGAIRRITPAAASLVGEPAEAVVGRPIVDFIDEFDLEAASSVHQGGGLEAPPVGHWQIRRASGEAIPINIQAGPLPEQADPEFIVLALADQSRSEMARDRSRDLHAQLSQVWRLNSMGQMAATLSHELNQPLTAAAVYLHAGQTDIARSGPLGDSAARSLDLAKTQLLRAGDIIRRMRDLISTGSRTFAEERVTSMIEDLAPVFFLISRDTDIPIRIDVQDDDSVLADRIQVQQAVTNLVRNGVDALSDRPHGLISVVGRSLGDAGYEIAVEDNGPGIAEADMDRIFQPMTTTKAGGMGLGLSVTRSIVESHGGQLTVGRSPLGGAAFSFRLPRFTEVEAA